MQRRRKYKNALFICIFSLPPCCSSPSPLHVPVPPFLFIITFIAVFVVFIAVVAVAF